MGNIAHSKLTSRAMGIDILGESSVPGLGVGPLNCSSWQGVTLVSPVVT